MDADKFKSVAINIKTYRLLEELSQKNLNCQSVCPSVSSSIFRKDTKSLKLMQIEKLSKELKAIRKIKSDEYGPFNKKMQDIADVWSVLIGKKLRPHQVALMYAMAKIIRANNEYKYDSYIDAINYLVQADEIHREDVSELVDSYFPTTSKEDVSV